MSRKLTRIASLLTLLFTVFLAGCSEEALTGLVAGSIAVYVIGAILLFVLVILALVDLYQGSYPLNKKLLWLVIILIIPYVGALLYFLVGRNRPASIT